MQATKIEINKNQKVLDQLEQVRILINQIDIPSEILKKSDVAQSFNELVTARKNVYNYVEYYSQEKKETMKTFIDLLNNPESRLIIEQLEWGCSDQRIIDDLKKELKEKFGFDWDTSEFVNNK